MGETREEQRRQIRHTAICPECGRVFDLFDDIDNEEWFYGHDCES